MGPQKIWLPGDPWVEPKPQLPENYKPSQYLQNIGDKFDEDNPRGVMFSLKNDRGEVFYRKDSFRRLLDNDSAKYHDNGQKEVFEEFQKYSIRSQYLINNKLKSAKVNANIE